MQKRIDKLEALYKINETILSITEVNKLLDRILKIIENTFGFDACAILFYDEPSNDLYIRAAIGYKEEMIKKFRTQIGGRGITGYVALTQEPLFVPNIQEDDRYISGMNNAKSEIAIPLVADGDLIGVLDIESQKEYSFTSDDYNVLCLFSKQISQAIHNALLIENERKKVSQLLVLNEIRKRVSVSLELDRLLQVVCTSIVEFFSYNHVLIFLYQDDDKQLELMARAGLEETTIPNHWADNINRQIVGEAFINNETIIINSAASNQFPSPLFENTESQLAIPLQLDNQPIGVLYLASETANIFGEKNRHILEALSEQITIIIRDASIFSHYSKRSKQLDVIHKIGQVAIQSFDLAKFIKEAVDFVQKTFDFYSVCVFTYEEVSQELELIAFAGEPLQDLTVGDKLSVMEGITGYVVRSGKYYLCNDVIKEKKYKDMLLNTKSELTLPIVHEQKILGVLNIESAKLNQFDKSDVDIFSKIADQIAYTITNAELFRQKSSAHNLLLNLNSLGREVNSSFDVKTILMTVVQKLPQFIQCRLCSIFFYQPREQKLVLMAHNLPGLRQEESMAIDASSENVLMTRVIELKRSIFVQDIEQELNIENRARYRTKSFLNILICHRERILGVLNLTDKVDSSHFTSQEFYLINSFCEHLANAIVNSEKYQKILELSITDGLTGLYVHRYFQESLSREMALAKRHRNALSLIMMDIDNFKNFNDTCGHQIGDIVLREIATLVKQELREYDIATRYGGEEFGIILPKTTRRQARLIAERLRQRIEKHTVTQGNKNLRLTVSMGIAEFEFSLNKYELIGQADAALLQAKELGKNRVFVYHDALDE